jgi:hypothetical protein
MTSTLYVGLGVLNSEFSTHLFEFDPLRKYVEFCGSVMIPYWTPDSPGSVRYGKSNIVLPVILLGCGIAAI